MRDNAVDATILDMINQKVTYQKIKQIADKIAKQFDPEKIILFGSYAWGKPDENSDVDLFVIKKTNNTRDTARDIRAYLWGKTAIIPMDIVVCHPLKLKNKIEHDRNLFLEDIVKNGIKLYENHQVRR